MKRLFVSLIMAIACCVGVMAEESRVATLQHGSNITAFYGEDALGAAHYNAVDGDIITLSSGEFKGCTVSKALTIRGEGIGKTIITSGCTFNIPNGSAHTLYLEGMRLSNSNNFNGTDATEKVVISKCANYSNGSNNSVSFSKCNATIIQSYISTWYGIYARNSSIVTCVNSAIYGVRCESQGRFDIQNCVLTGTGTNNQSLSHSSIKNSIICGACTLNSTNISSHCIVKEGSSGFADSWYIQENPNQYDTSAVSWGDLFSDGSYHLSEAAAAAYLGTDGTQVGLYGGMYPYDNDFTPSYPLVKKLDVTGSHKNGRLNIKINVE